jgi:hypothetical protein
MPERSARRSLAGPGERQPHAVLDLQIRPVRRAMPVIAGRPATGLLPSVNLPRRRTTDWRC